MRYVSKDIEFLHAQLAAADRFGSVSGTFSFCLLTICCGTLSAHEVIYHAIKEPWLYHCSGRNQMGSTRFTDM
jgi:hypothetical protein